MTLDEFVKKYKGKELDYDKRYEGQCVDLYRYYLKEVLGFPQTELVAGASQIWDTKSNNFIKIKNTLEAVPQKGDIIIWSKYYDGIYGHVAIYLDGNVRTFSAFSQNDPIGEKCIVREYGYRNIIGWLRPKKGGENVEELQKIADFIKSKGVGEGNMEPAVRNWWESDRVLNEEAKPKMENQENQITKLQQDIVLLTEKVKLLERLAENGEVKDKLEAEEVPDPFSDIKKIGRYIYDLVNKPQDLYRALRRVRNYVLSFIIVNLIYFVSDGQDITNFDITTLVSDEVAMKALIAALITGISKYIRTKNLPQPLSFLRKLFKWV